MNWSRWGQSRRRRNENRPPASRPAYGVVALRDAWRERRAGRIASRISGPVRGFVRPGKSSVTAKESVGELTAVTSLSPRCSCGDGAHASKCWSTRLIGSRVMSGIVFDQADRLSAPGRRAQRKAEVSPWPLMSCAARKQRIAVPWLIPAAFRALRARSRRVAFWINPGAELVASSEKGSFGRDLTGRNRHFHRA